ncbi:MAG: hypothetical protein KDC95_13670 [Planctomycetes bacterium]|nr:hypothetical protein [Planctomycetota bacterium]
MMRPASIALALLPVSLAVLVPVAWGSPQRDAIREAAPSAFVALSRELSTVVREGRGLTLAIRNSSQRRFGIYLGKGVVAAPYVDGIERGASASLSTPAGTFGLRALGSVGRARQRKPVVTFFVLANPVELAEPDVRTAAPRGWREDVGDMVLLFEPMNTRIAFVRQSIGLKAEDGQFSPQARGPKDDPYMHMLAIPDGEAGAAVVNAKGEVVGMVLRLETPIGRRRSGPRGATGNRSNGDGDGQNGNSEAGEASEREGTAESSTKTSSDPESSDTKRNDTKSDDEPADRRDVRVTCGAIDIHWLRARAEHELKQPLPPAPRSIGISINLFQERKAPGDPKKPDARGDTAEAAKKQFVVTHVLLGSPASQSGVKLWDVWTSIDGEPLTSFEQLKAAIQGREQLEVRYERRGVAGTYSVKPR